jgi:lysyl-tRNA synthetase class 2
MDSTRVFNMRLKYQFQLLRAIRNYFDKKDFLEVMTPPMVENPGMETHIHPFKVTSVTDKKWPAQYLQTSPEFWMKDLLASPEEELDRIYNLSYCFRDEPSSPEHRNQFIMCEWYRKNERYESIMRDCEELIPHCFNELAAAGAPVREELRTFNMQKVTIQELFENYLHINILDFLDTKELKLKIKKDFKDVILPKVDCTWDDYYFLLFLNMIEPKLRQLPAILLYEFPAPLAALSTIKESNQDVCERFEVYLNGLELCNCFNELTNLDTLKRRFDEQAKDKKKLYKYKLPEPSVIYDAMERGLPPSSGVALGVERLLMGLTRIENPFFN